MEFDDRTTSASDFEVTGGVRPLTEESAGVADVRAGVTDTPLVCLPFARAVEVSGASGEVLSPLVSASVVAAPSCRCSSCCCSRSFAASAMERRKETYLSIAGGMLDICSGPRQHELRHSTKRCRTP